MKSFKQRNNMTGFAFLKCNTGHTAKNELEGVKAQEDIGVIYVGSDVNINLVSVVRMKRSRRN